MTFLSRLTGLRRDRQADSWT